MKQLFHTLFLSSIVCLLAWFPVQAQTQGEMNSDQCAESVKATEEMDRLYTQLLDKHKGDAEIIENIKKAQTAWLNFQDAQLQSQFSQNPAYYGSAHPMCVCQATLNLTQQRIEQFKTILNSEEGDICAGNL